MCGLIGISRASPASGPDFERALNSLGRRGPDHREYRAFDSGRTLLGHSRLSIIDLSEKGNQPLHNEDETLWLVFNGEIYNYIELRKELESLSHRFYTQTDAEVILHAYEEWNEGCLDRFRGIFAFAIYDTRNKSFFLARDPFGTKPLYYSWAKGTFAFASQPSAIDLALNRKPAIDEFWLRAFLVFGNVPGKGCIYAGIEKLSPGCYMRHDGREPEVVRYARRYSSGAGSTADPGEMAAGLRRQLSETVALNQRSDVPVAYFLSGGVDSSIVCSLAQAHSDSPIQTFNVGFDSVESDETPHALKASKAIGTRHHWARFNLEKALRQIPAAIASVDEPFNINGLVPYSFLCQQVHELGFKVAVSGDGADELFGGYRWHESWWRQQEKRRKPGFALRSLIRNFAGSGAGHENQGYLHHFLQYSGGNSPGLAATGEPGRDVESFVSDGLGWALEREEKHSMTFPLAFDQECFLPDHCLVKVDRASMYFGLEVRVPFLDQRVAELIGGLEPSVLLAGGERKHLLKKAFEPELRSLNIERKKGFSSPLEHWWQNGLCAVAEEVFEHSELARNHDLVRHLVRTSRARADVRSQVNLLSLCLWQDRWMGERHFEDPGRFRAASGAGSGP